MPTIRKSVLLIGLGVLSVLAILLYFSFNPEKGLFFPKCPSYQYLGIYCSGCGSQRAIHDLLHLRIGDALSHNMLLLPALFVLAQHGLVKARVLKTKSFLNYRYAPIIVLIMVLLFMFLRNLTIYPFAYLAP
ncbi:DUF2752 domain-containing protein [Muricauda sp. MAR_2010_75]|jgi:hypothetical protein|uniref:DUF2752 domain-containing protein n=1 Tax=Allomuricauda sp. MAR_2010_75 TaxID=1250232 RepID=UPI00055EFD2C|nr:DUF2752 domain-containing protein [Muricauda sp. MAR_2010_75]